MSSMQRLLFDPAGSPTWHEPKLVLALQHPALQPEMIQQLSPRVMLWQNSNTQTDNEADHAPIWLIDITPCLSYWQSQARALNIPVERLWQTILDQALNPSNDPNAAPYQLVAAPHPWQAILLLQMMKERELSGYLDQQAPIGQSIFQTLTWSAWWHCLEQIEPHLLTERDRAQLRRNRRKMALSMQRLGLKKPLDMKQVESAAMGRRFGSILQNIWAWTIIGIRERLNTTATPAAAHEHSLLFPWQSWTWGEVPQVTRHLDFPLIIWDHMEPLLQEDFNRLCQGTALVPGERVVGLEWRLVLHDLTVLVIPVLFRHPHRLHDEAPHHRTALLQTRYRFDDVVRKLHDSLGSDITLPSIISWHLAITHKLRLPPQMINIFADGSNQEATLLELDNMLPIPLKKYELTPTWQPEYAFAEEGSVISPLGIAATQELRDVMQHSLLTAARHRPLYLATTPQPWEPSNEGAGQWQFTERLMTRWWDGEPKRDYYQVVNHHHQKLWVYQDREKHKWYCQGFFS